MDALADLELGTIGGGLALALAVVQLALRGRLDLGPVTLAAVAGTLLLVPGPSTLAAGLLAASVVIAAVAQWLGVARGVGRPELGGLVVAVAVLGGLASLELPRHGVDAGAVRDGAAGAVALAGAVSLLLARERRGLRGQRVYHWREVPVRAADERAASREVG